MLILFITTIFILSLSCFIYFEEKNYNSTINLGSFLGSIKIKETFIFIISFTFIATLYYQIFVGFDIEKYRAISISAILVFSFILILEFGLEKSKWLLGASYTFIGLSTYLSSIVFSDYISRNLNVSPEKLSTLIKNATFLNLYDMSIILINITLSIAGLFLLFYCLFIYTTSFFGILYLKPHLLKYKKGGLLKDFSWVRLLCSALLFFSSSFIYIIDSKNLFEETEISKKINSIFYLNEGRCKNPNLSNKYIYIYETNRVITLEEKNKTSIYDETFCKMVLTGHPP